MTGASTEKQKEHSTSADTHSDHHVEGGISHDYTDVRTILEWMAPGRPFRKKGKEYFTSVLLITCLVEVILFLFSQYELMLAVLSLTFLAIVLSVVPPRDFRYKISTEGITIEDHFYLWTELYDFYFKKIDGVETLFVRTHTIIPGVLRIPLGALSRDEVRKKLLRYLPYREVVRLTFMEKSADWLSKTFPLEKPHHRSTS